MLLLPGAIIGLIGLHLLPRDPPRRHLAAVVEGGRRHGPTTAAGADRERAARPPAPRGERRRRGRSDRVDERQRVFKQYKEDVKERGKPFFPYAMLHDTIMSLVVVVVIIGLAVIWKFTTPGDHTARATSRQSGWLGKLYDDPADPGTISFVPRPDWYFYFLFYLLRIFKWPESVILGTIGIPTIALILLIALPFFDRRASGGRSSRPVAMVAERPRRSSSMGVAHLQGRDREGVARHRARARCRTGPRSRASPTTRPRSRARSSSRRSAASTATPTSAPAATTSARPTCRDRGSKGRGV